MNTEICVAFSFVRFVTATTAISFVSSFVCVYEIAISVCSIANELHKASEWDENSEKTRPTHYQTKQNICLPFSHPNIKLLWIFYFVYSGWSVRAVGAFSCTRLPVFFFKFSSSFTQFTRFVCVCVFVGMYWYGFPSTIHTHFVVFSLVNSLYKICFFGIEQFLQAEL